MPQGPSICADVASPPLPVVPAVPVPAKREMVPDVLTLRTRWPEYSAM